MTAIKYVFYFLTKDFDRIQVRTFLLNLTAFQLKLSVKRKSTDVFLASKNSSNIQECNFSQSCFIILWVNKLALYVSKPSTAVKILWYSDFPFRSYLYKAGEKHTYWTFYMLVHSWNYSFMVHCTSAESVYKFIYLSFLSLEKVE